MSAPSKPRVEVFVRNVYGKPVFYPANDAAQAFADLAGSKSINPNQAKYIMALGFEIFEVPDPAGGLRPLFQKVAA